MAGPKQETPANFEPEKVGPEYHQLAGYGQYPEVWGRVLRQGMVPGKRLTPRAKGAAPHNHGLGFKQSPGWVHRPHSQCYQARLCRDLEIMKQHPGQQLSGISSL